jgi:hypothetical protein
MRLGGDAAGPDADDGRVAPPRFHDLRHSFGSLVVRELDTATLKAWTGHSSSPQPSGTSKPSRGTPMSRVSTERSPVRRSHP